MIGPCGCLCDVKPDLECHTPGEDPEAVHDKRIDHVPRRFSGQECSGELSVYRVEDVTPDYWIALRCGHCKEIMKKDEPVHRPPHAGCDVRHNVGVGDILCKGSDKGE